jgi:glutathione synthase/RimK-type ligase-like ATP-grasp enzyme
LVWSDRTVAWEAYDVVVLRSTWDYHRRIAEFLEWVDLVSSRTRLFNPAPVVRWNSHKSYLRDLGRAGVPTVPTVWGSEVSSATEALRARGWTRAVLKPAVSANAENTHLLEVGRPQANEAVFRRLREGGEVLLQPYMEAVDGPGERSLVFLDGTYSHAALRSPQLSPGSSLRNGQPVEPSSAELDVGRRALATVRPLPLYGRVDLVADAAGKPCVMELEVIEPFLYLAAGPGSPERLARAIRLRAA